MFFQGGQIGIPPDYSLGPYLLVIYSGLAMVELYDNVSLLEYLKSSVHPNVSMLKYVERPKTYRTQRIEVQSFLLFRHVAPPPSEDRVTNASDP